MKEEFSKMRCRLIFDTTVEIRQEVKRRAIEKNIPMSTWIKRAILEAIKQEDKYK